MLTLYEENSKTLAGGKKEVLDVEKEVSAS